MLLQPELLVLSSHKKPCQRELKWTLLAIFQGHSRHKHQLCSSSLSHTLPTVFILLMGNILRQASFTIGLTFILYLPYTYKFSTQEGKKKSNSLNNISQIFCQIINSFHSARLSCAICMWQYKILWKSLTLKQYIRCVLTKQHLLCQTTCSTRMTYTFRFFSRNRLLKYTCNPFYLYYKD